MHKNALLWRDSMVEVGWRVFSITASRNDEPLKPHKPLSPLFFKFRDSFFCYRLDSDFLSFILASLPGILFALFHSYLLLLCFDFLILFLVILERFLKFSFHQWMGFSAPRIGPFLVVASRVVWWFSPHCGFFPLLALLMTLFLLMPSYIFKWHQDISLKYFFSSHWGIYFPEISFSSEPSRCCFLCLGIKNASILLNYLMAFLFFSGKHQTSFQTGRLEADMVNELLLLLLCSAYGGISWNALGGQVSVHSSKPISSFWWLFV